MRRNSLLTGSLFVTAMLTSGAAFAQQKGAAAKGPGPKSQGEAQAVNAVIQAQQQSPDEEIKAVDALIAKYSDTVFKSFALELEAEAWQKKGDNTKAIVFAEQALQADPKNFDAANLLANITAATTKDTDLDKDEKLTRADKYAHDALETLESGAKPALFANLSDEQWTKMKNKAEADSWQALGAVASVRKKNDEAITDYQKGVDLSNDPLMMIRLGRALLAAKRYDEAVTWDEKVMNSADAPQQYKSIAQADRARAIQAKGGPAPAPPAQAHRFRTKPECPPISTNWNPPSAIASATVRC
jgi:tetratricopeptide (TPR) repeat protein